MENNTIITLKTIDDIWTLRTNRKTFKINDINGLWKCKVMIIWIHHNEIKDDIVKLIDMWEMSDTFDVIDYEIPLKDLCRAYQLAN